MKKHRFGAADIVLLLLLAGAGIFAVVRTGEVLHYTWRWQLIPRYILRRDPATGALRAGLLTQGFLTTIRLSVWSSLFALLIGTVMGSIGSGRRLIARMVRTVYVGFCRSIPPLVLVFLFYFFFGSQILAVLRVDDWVRSLGSGAKTAVAFLFERPERFPEFLSAVITLGLYEGAYMTEIIRAGIQSVPRGQVEAAEALGLKAVHRYGYVILPQAVRTILPALAGQFISAVKDSAIVSVISIRELTFQGKEMISATYLTFETWLTVAAMYFVVTFACSAAASRLEKRLARPVRRD